MSAPEPLPLSLHHVDSTWVNQRAKELSDARGHKRPDIKGALTEVADKFVDEVGDNLDESRDLAVYQPSGDTDPYIIAVPIKDTVTAVIESRPPVPGVFRPHEEPNTIQEDFENFIFETDTGAQPFELEKDSTGRYIHKSIRLMWYGFNLYHQKMTMARRAEFRAAYHKALGSYIVGKVYSNGATIFTKVPVRYRNKAQALEEANRLLDEQGEAWAVWRCIDILGSQDIKLPEEDVPNE